MVKVFLRKHVKVFTVFSFLRLQSKDICYYKWIYPTFVAVLLFGVIEIGGNDYFFVDKEKLISDINALVSKLAGFYIAALAAVSSFGNEFLDNEMKGESPPTLKSLRQGKQHEEKLSRRRFLAILLGYCTGLAILLYLLGILQVHLSIDQPVFEWTQKVMHSGGQLIFVLYLWIISSLLVVTLLALHYLVERMYRE